MLLLLKKKVLNYDATDLYVPIKTCSIITEQVHKSQSRNQNLWYPAKVNKSWQIASYICKYIFPFLIIVHWYLIHIGNPIQIIAKKPKAI